MKHEASVELAGGKTLRFETGHLAKQAHGSCIVRMAEIHDRSAVFTLDSDFIVYRKNGRTPIELVCPPMN